MRGVVIIISLAAAALAACLLAVLVEGVAEPADPWTRPDCPGQTCPYKTVAPMEIFPEDRQSNYGGGSCYHASLISGLRYMGMRNTADRWRKNYGGGAYTSDLIGIAESLNLDYAYTASGDAAFLAWCSRTRRPAAIHWPGNRYAHAITFCGYRGNDAVLLDNNNVSKLFYVPKEQFLRIWKDQGGGAITVLGEPPPLRPWLCPTKS